MTNKHQLLLTAGVCLGILMYTLPWLVATNAGLSFGGNDLAEWASLHPQNRETTPTLLTSLLLRLPLACLIIAYNWATKRTWITTLITASVLILLMPPLEIITSARNDVNYIQQIAIVGVTLTASSIKMIDFRVSIALLIIAIISSSVGIYQAHNLIQQFQINIQVGTGFVMMIGVFVIIAAFLLWHIRQGKFTLAD